MSAPRYPRPRHLVTARRERQQLPPVRHFDVRQRMAGVRMAIDRPVELHRGDAAAGCDVETDADRALVQVGLAVRFLRCESQHAHHRITLEHDQADVRHAFIADVLERRVAGHQRFDEGDIGASAERVQAADDVREMTLHIGQRELTAARFDEVVSVVTNDHQDAFAAAAARRFDRRIWVNFARICSMCSISCCSRITSSSSGAVTPALRTTSFVSSLSSTSG